MAWTTFTLRATTPIFNAGAFPDPNQNMAADSDPGVRVSSIRGAMRFWFRALAATVTGSDLRLLSAMETHVFGGPGTASPCLLRTPPTNNGTLQPALDDNKRPGFMRDVSDRWVAYLLGLGLAEQAGKGRFQLLRPFVAPGTQFPLKMGFRHPRDSTDDHRHAVEAGAFAALWLTATYGGLGARTRRGFGAFQIMNAEGPTPEPWTAQRPFRSPDLAYYETFSTLAPTGQLAQVADLLVHLIPAQHRPAADTAERPDFPVLSGKYTTAGLSRDSAQSLADLLARTGYKLRGFRTSDTHQSGTNHFQPNKSTPEWKAMNAGTLADYPMGALGLPVLYRPKGEGDAFTVNLTDETHNELRHTSKLWLHPIQGVNEQWRLFSFGFLHQFPPSAPGIQLSLQRNDRPLQALTADQASTDALINAWIKSPLPQINKPNRAPRR